MIIFTYIFLLLLMLIIITNGIIFCFKYAPLKIRILSLFVLIASACRYITLIIFYMHKSINYLYPLRFLYFLNILYIPIMAFIILYILFRSDKIKFELIIIISVILILLFSIIFINAKINLFVSDNAFYAMTITSPIFVYAFYLIINILVMVTSIFMLNKSNINKMGVIFILLAATVVVCEIILSFFGIAFLPERIIGDVLWAIALNYALYKLKK